MLKIRVTRWDENEFDRAEHEWQSLLMQSQSDPLFLSWDWQHAWWNIFLKPLGAELLLLVAYGEDHNLLGIAPLYAMNTKIRSFIPVKRIQFIGQRWRSTGTVRTEYLDVIASPDLHAEIVKAFMSYLYNEQQWDEFIFPNLDMNSITYGVLGSPEIRRSADMREVEPHQSYCVDTRGTFTDYLASLSSKTRLNLYNRRKYLEGLGTLELRQADATTLGIFFDTLNAFHRKRWKKDLFSGSRLKFHQELATKMLAKNALNFSMLFLSGKPLSVLYNIRIGQHEYGIQMGFDDSFDKKVSIAVLHIGYLIEKAFRDQLDVFDFLAGEGKQEKYKQRLTDTSRKMVALHFVRSKWLRLAYLLHSRLQRIGKS